MYAVASAQLPEPPAGADRLFVAPNAVIVLDGASAFGPSNPDPAEYVDRLGAHLRDALVSNPGADLTRALADAIEATANALELTPGLSPSSTVAIARWTATEVDLLVLGDSQIATPHGLIRDERLGAVGVHERHTYRTRLASGYGFDDQHRSLLADLQASQATRRNRADGYWIAEADPAAATHAITESHSTESTPWLILATDGAYRPLEHLGIDVPPAAKDPDLAALVRECERWEAETDPLGLQLPRAKVHDDKTIVALQQTTG